MRALVLSAFALLGLPGCQDAPMIHAPLPPASTFAGYGDQVVTALMQDLWAGGGQWHACDGGCDRGNLDWGDDALTFVLYLRWVTTRDGTLAPLFGALTSTATSYGSCDGSLCSDWSDTPEWDAIADEREFEVSGDPHALELAKRAYRQVRSSDAYGGGACPTIRFQHPNGGGGGLKTLETDSNAIKAALLLWKQTGEAGYLDDAIATYQAVRGYFLDPQHPLYTVYVYDDGHACTQLPGRFFASVNGNMIWSGWALAQATGDPSYLAQAVETANAVDTLLADGRGVFANLLAENDVAEPLVEAFYLLATDGFDFARAWIVRNADAAMRNSRVPDGLYGRFFDGPRQTAPITAWQSNGGMALAVAAAALDPTHAVAAGGDWAAAQSVPAEITALPSSLTFIGSGVALLGTLGEHCCESGHASLAIDGVPTIDGTGIWQDKSSAGRSFDDAVLFAWQWPGSAEHTLTFGPSTTNAKEGSPFLHIRGYLLLP